MTKKNIRVLIVDDEERFRITAAASLKRRGFNIMTAASGGDALDKIIVSDFDVVVLDVKMPGMDGNQALRVIKAIKPKLEVIMLTGHRTDDSELQAWRSQVSAYLTKPCDIKLLAETIDKVYSEALPGSSGGVLKMNKNKTINVLLVDDEDRFRATMTATLEKRGFQAKAVGSGAEALEEVKRGGIDIVVLDIKMPGMNGHRVLREINKLDSDVEVIMLTAYASMDSALEGLHDNVFAYMAKPCDIELLVNRIREAFARKERLSIHSLEQSTQPVD